MGGERSLRSDASRCRGCADSRANCSRPGTSAELPLNLDLSENPPGWQCLLSEDRVNPDLPVKRSDDLRFQIFLSFSHDDQDRAYAIAHTLIQNGIPVWIDYRNIVPGTPDWENSIREGLAKVLLSLSLHPPNRDDRNTFARSWHLLAPRICRFTRFGLTATNGPPDCIALDLVFTQYIDAREQREPEGNKQLCSVITALSCNIAPDHLIIEDALTIISTDTRTTYKDAKVPAGYISIFC